MIRRPIPVVSLLLVVLSLWPALSGCGRTAHRANVIVISLDTLRADSLGVYGSTQGSTPHLDAHFESAVVFRRAYTPEPQTLSAHASLFTSTHPSSHGVTGRLSGGIALPSGLATLAEVLTAQGYSTAAFVNAGFLHPRFGLARGFAIYDYKSDIEDRGPEAGFGRSAGDTNAAVFRWLDAEPAEPWLLFVHYFDPHSDPGVLPYDSPPRYRKHLGGRIAWGAGSGSTYLSTLNHNGSTLGPAKQARLAALYESGVRYTDDGFGELADGLEERGLFEDAVSVVLADHGEEIQDHGRFLHVQLYDENLRIPLCIRFPDAAGIGPRVIEQPIGLIDLMPTLLEAVGVESPPGLQGRSLMPLIEGASGWEPRNLYFESRSSGQLAMLDPVAMHKAIFDARGGTVELYDLHTDPGEQHDLAAARPEEARRAAQTIVRWFRDAPRLFLESEAETITLDDETVEQLRQLGYADPSD